MKSFKPKQLSMLITSYFRELFRQPEVLFWGVIFPILMALGLGIAFTQKANVEKHIAVIVNQQQPSSDLQFEDFLKNRTEKIKENNKNEYKLVIKDKKLGNTTFFFQEVNWKEATILLKRGEISLIVEETTNGIKYHFDPVSPDGQLTYLALSRLVQNKETYNDESNVEPLTVKGTRYIDFFIPGLIAMGVMMSSVWGSSFGIIDRRAKKLLRRMIATPMKKSHFLISLLVGRTTMNFLEACLLFFFAYLVFGITIQGSVLALILIFLVSNFAFAGIAFLISSRTASTEAGNGLINAVLTPMIVLSGIFFSYHNFPDVIIPIIKILPLTLLADSVRSIFIEGAGFQEIAIPFFVLTGMGIVFFSLGLKMFKWH
jgi:ABC-2 type transport system permease protein